MKILLAFFLLTGCTVTYNNARNEPEQEPHSRIIIRDIGTLAMEGAL